MEGANMSGDKNTAVAQDPIEGEVVPMPATSEERKNHGGEITVPKVSSLTDRMTTKQLEASTKKAQEHRAIISKYVSDHLVDGVDYGKIATFPKNVLFKPGQEKIFSLMNLTSRLERDTETLEMLPDEKGLVAYLCRVYRNGVEIAQGRGAATIGDKSRDANATIKIAEKRARMDACLSLGFSEFFTQDLEDPEYRDTAGNGGSGATATDKQRALIAKKLEENGVAKDDQKGYIIEQFGVEVPLTKEGASFVIEQLIGSR
jgi:uncharacterized protein YbaA (DUF1428 family)